MFANLVSFLGRGPLLAGHRHAAERDPARGREHPGGRAQGPPGLPGLPPSLAHAGHGPGGRQRGRVHAEEDAVLRGINFVNGAGERGATRC